MNDKYEDLLNEISEYRKIDLLDLHTEWQKQSPIYGMYSDALSEMSFERDILKKDIDRLYAKLDLEYRKEKIKKKERIVEGEIRSLVETDKNYIKLYNKYFKLCKIVGRFQSAVKSLEMKKKSLEREVDLFINKYWSVPKERKNIVEFKTKASATRTNEQRKLLNRK